MRAGAVLLVNLYWQLTSQAPAEACRAHSDSWPVLHTLPCLRPFLTGHVAHAIDRILADPHIPMETMMDMLGRVASSGGWARREG